MLKTFLKNKIKIKKQPVLFGRMYHDWFENTFSNIFDKKKKAAKKYLPQNFKQPDTDLPQKEYHILEEGADNYGDKIVKYKPATRQEKEYIIHVEEVYTAFNVTRQQACDLLKQHYVESKPIRKLIETIIEEKQSDLLFLRYLEEKKVVKADKIIEAYIDYDVKEKKFDDGLPHPLVLRALAEIQKIELHIWQRSDKKDLVPHDNYPLYKPKDAVSRLDLLFEKFEKSERFQKLEFKNAHYTTAEYKNYVEGLIKGRAEFSYRFQLGFLIAGISFLVTLFFNELSEKHTKFASISKDLNEIFKEKTEISLSFLTPIKNIDCVTEFDSDSLEQLYKIYVKISSHNDIVSGLKKQIGDIYYFQKYYFILPVVGSLVSVITAGHQLLKVKGVNFFPLYLFCLSLTPLMVPAISRVVFYNQANENLKQCSDYTKAFQHYLTTIQVLDMCARNMHEEAIEFVKGKIKNGKDSAFDATFIHKNKKDFLLEMGLITFICLVYPSNSNKKILSVFDKVTEDGSTINSETSKKNQYDIILEVFNALKLEEKNSEAEKETYYNYKIGVLYHNAAFAYLKKAEEKLNLQNTIENQDKIKKYLQEARKNTVETQDHMPYYSSGLFKKLKGENDEAEKYFKTALLMNPNHKKTKECLKEILNFKKPNFSLETDSLKNEIFLSTKEENGETTLFYQAYKKEKDIFGGSLTIKKEMNNYKFFKTVVDAVKEKKLENLTQENTEKLLNVISENSIINFGKNNTK